MTTLPLKSTLEEVTADLIFSMELSNMVSSQVRQLITNKVTLLNDKLVTPLACHQDVHSYPAASFTFRKLIMYFISQSLGVLFISPSINANNTCHSSQIDAWRCHVRAILNSHK